MPPRPCPSTPIIRHVPIPTPRKIHTRAIITDQKDTYKQRNGQRAEDVEDEAGQGVKGEDARDETEEEGGWGVQG